MNTGSKNTRNRLSLAAAIVLAAVVSTTWAQVKPEVGGAGKPKVAKIGEPAPDFTLADTKGGERRLSHFTGKIVVLEWINPDCPIVQRQYRTKAMQEAYERVKSMEPEVVWLAINSTHMATAEKNDFWIDDHDLEYPILLDGDGSVGRLYDARLTPHMYVIDAKGILRYEGAVDDNRLGNKPPGEAKSHVVCAVGQILEGLEVSPDHAKPYGCRIKYRR